MTPCMENLSARRVVAVRRWWLIGLAVVLLWIPVVPATAGTASNGGCDFDGDGYDDLPIGVPKEAVNGDTLAGAVNVLYGSANRLTAKGDQIWHQDSAGIDDATEQGDYFGLVVECGDFNDDEYSDLAIGVPYEDLINPSTGVVHILYGSSAGLSAEDAMLLHRDVPGVRGEAKAYDLFGWSLSAGDFDGDGDDDLAVGVPGDAPKGIEGPGSVHVFKGSPGGLTDKGDKIWQRNTPGIIGAAEDGQFFGGSLAVGDFDGDGWDDLAIGAPRSTAGGETWAGLVNVIYGSGSGLTAAGDQVWHRAKPGVNGSPDNSDQFGLVMTAGDFDGDGNEDLAVGVRFDEVNGDANAGSVSVLYGSGAGLTSTGDQLWHRDKPGVNASSQPHDGFGGSLAAGDVNGNGKADLLIGVPGDDFGGLTSPGSVHVLYGYGAGLKATNDEVWHQDKPGINGAAEEFDIFGDTVATGDFNGNGRDDLVVGVAFEDVGSVEDAGQVNVIYGKTVGLTSSGDQKWSQDSPGVLGMAEEGDRFGNVNHVSGWW